MIQLKNLTKTIEGDRILDEITLTLGEGLTFLTGPSGSGKSTLLRLLSGIDGAYEGEIKLGGQVLSELKGKEKSYLLNQKVGFIWQDYKLFNEMTVYENMMMPTHLAKRKVPNAEKIMNQLKLSVYSGTKVRDLSGGQRQRVAIARELMKDPDYLLADEPTSALDKETVADVMAIFRDLAKTRNVIIVTHDKTQLLETDQVVELAKGRVKETRNLDETAVNPALKLEKNRVLAFRKVATLLKTMVMTHKGRFLTAILALILGTTLLLGATSGTVEESKEGGLDNVLETYGDTVLDMSLVGSFMSAAGTDGDDDQGPSADVNQDVSSLYKRYKEDERVQFVAYSVAFNDIKIKVDGEEHTVQSSGNAPVINKVLAGRMANGKENEVVVPVSFVEKLGLSNEEALGKEIDFSATVTTWKGDEPIFKPTQAKAKIVGVIGTTIVTGTGPDIFTYEIEDSFFFSESALTKLLSVSDKKVSESNFILRATTPQTLIELRDEMTSEGIVPLGNFEVVEDVVNLSEETDEQKSNVQGIMLIVVTVMIVAIYLISSLLRRKEYAIYKLNGYDKVNLTLLNTVETVLEIVLAGVLLIILAPILTNIMGSVMGVEEPVQQPVNQTLLVVTVLGLLGGIVREVILRTTTVMRAFKVGKN
ncbi:ATP-binding cassette domain-containing protein [Vagococcus sp. PNs007]|uniref:ATP-binding cassette domain-containing protein n=1 Tax=Vagococcus proximus TaxID=2991417 RepID=A0ABT5X1L3_9ENTE|nr:ATP-binding cassette domain-containing protein [Vagococcus proximus]MDF0479880.1 ATP-binding cassette domain-containing protein [Vagococcus proximus]